MSGDILSGQILGVGIMASSGRRQGFHYTILQSTLQHSLPTPLRMVQPQGSVVPRHSILLELQRVIFTHLSYSLHTKFESLPDFGSVRPFTLSRRE